MRGLATRHGLAIGAALVICVGGVAGLLYFRHATSAALAPSDNHAVTRRLSEAQYRNIIADVFGPDIVVGGRFEPDLRRDGLLAVGASHVSITQTGLEQYYAMAISVATQVVDRDHRDLILPCRPISPTSADRACATRFLSRVGRYLYRRPLSEAEVAALARVADAAATKLGDFYAGVQMSLANMLVSPNFLFRKESVETDPDHPGGYRLDAYSKASRISFFLWNTAPDEVLLKAAEDGELNSHRGLDAQVDRLLASDRLASGVRAFFVDMLNFDDFATLAKDPLIYPKYSAAAAADVPEQTLRTIVDHLLVRQGDYRDLFTTRKTFMTRTLGALYGIPVIDDVPNGLPARWLPFEYPAGDQRAGILVQASFVALHSHPGRSSPTLRGRAMRELLLCQKVPDPPNDVTFAVVQDTSNPLYKTARARLAAHRTAPTCAGCHKITDPLGLTLEHFDSAAGYRETENGATIDTSGDLDGVRYTDAASLGKAVHDNPATSSCLVNRLYAYAVGQSPSRNELALLKGLTRDFADHDYRVPDLMRTIATGDSFNRVSVVQQVAADSFLHSLTQGKSR